MNQQEIGQQLARLMAWYQSMCNGDWEHSYGVTLDTLDNPGWLLKVDLIETDLQGRVAELRQFNTGREQWWQARADGLKFEAAGGPLTLPLLIKAFFEFVDEHLNRPSV